MERLNKFLARKGIASRRKCDVLIQAGKVKVEGKVVTDPAIKVPENAKIEVEGFSFLPEEKVVYIMFYKPRGYLTTLWDPYDRPTIMKFFTQVPYRIFPVGRLDADSEGLLLLTNDGEINYVLTHPRFQVEKKYLVYVNGKVEEEALHFLSRGVVIKGVSYRILWGRVREHHPTYTVTEVTLCEGKKHEIRILFDYLGHPVLRLIRVSAGPIHLDLKLLPGSWRYFEEEEIEILREYVKGRKLCLKKE
ncbi:MAG: pseudouridine synthase [Candidatus Caldatribacteriaceae bacterium]